MNILVRSESMHEVGPGIESISVTLPSKGDSQVPTSRDIFSGPSAVTAAPAEQHPQLYPALTLRRREFAGLGPAGRENLLLGDRPWIMSLLELAGEVSELLGRAADLDDEALTRALLDDINNVEILSAYRRIMVGG